MITAFSCESGGNEDDSFQTRRDSVFANREAEIQRFAQRSGDFISVRDWKGISTLAYQQLVDSGRAILFEGLMQDIFRREDSTVALVIALTSDSSGKLLSLHPVLLSHAFGVQLGGLLTGNILECYTDSLSIAYSTTLGTRVVVLATVDSVKSFTYTGGADPPEIMTVRRFAGRCMDLMDASINPEMLLGIDLP